MAQQWGVNTGQPGFQYPMQTGFQPNPNLQQFQQQTPAALAPQPTGFPAQRPQFQQPQQTGYPTMNMGSIQPQVTGYPMQSMGFQQQVPPVPPLPSGFGAQRAPPPPPPQRSFLSPSPGLTPQMTGFPGAPAAPLVPQVTGYTDPRLLMMSSTFMPANPSMPFSGSGAPQFAGIPQSGPGAGAGSLVQSMQQYNQETQSAPPKMQWALTRAEKKQYDQIFRSWDSQGTGFISGQMALEVFGQSGLEKNDLAKIWALADADNRGKLNLAEFHVAMGLIYRKLNGLPIPDQLPPELVPPSSRDLDTSVNFLKDILKNDTSRPGSADAISRGKVRSFNDSSPVGGGGRKDGTVYRYTDDNDGGSVYQSRSRHIDRRNVRVGNESPGEDLETMRRQLENAARTLEKSDEEQRNRTREDEELEREMEDLRYRVKRIQEDLEYVSRGPRSTAKDEERRKLERDLMHLMHERIPEVQRKQEERERRKEREKREWNRDRDRRNERFGRYDDRDRERDEGYNRGTYDRDRSRDRRDRDYDRDRDRDRDRDYDHSYGRDRDWDRDRDRERDRPRSPPANARSPPPPPPAASAAPSVPPAPPKPSTTPAPSMKNMSADERAAYIREQAQLKLQERMRALGVVTPAPSSGSPASPTVDTTVEDRLAREKKEAEEKALQAEKDAEERERVRKERLENERALKEGRATTPVAPATPPVPPVASATVKAAPPPPPIGQKRPPPPPVKRGQAPRPPVVSPAPPPPAPPVVPITPAPAEVDPEEEMLREREERLRKQREAREARLRQLEQEEEEARKAEEEYQKRRAEFQKQQQAPTPAVVPPTPAETQAQSPPPPPPPPVLPTSSLESPAVGTPGEKHSTNPFSKFMSQGNGSVAATTPTSSPSTGSTNPFFKPQQPATSISSAPTPTVAPFKPPTPVHSSVPPPVKTSYQTAPTDDDDWGKELDDDDDSSDDEIATSRNARDMLAQQLFGSSASRPQSASGSHPVKSQTPTPGPLSAPPTSAPTLPPAPPPPPPAPPADAISTFTPPAPPQPPVAPPPPAAIAAPVAAGAGNRSALMGSILAGTKLRKAVTNDRSAASVSGSVVGDSAPPEHILNAPRPVSPPAPSANPYTQESIAPSTPSIPVVPEGDVRVNHRQSVDWYAGLAADQGVLNPLPPTIEENESEEERTTIVPAIQVDEAPTEDATDLLDDVDKSKEYRVRTLYSYEAQRPEDLSFSENIIISANPSKSGGAWWYGKNAKTGKSGFFPSTYVQELGNIKAKALYSYTGENPDELPFVEGDTLTIVDQSEADWWKTEQGGVIFIVPAAYFEVIEG